VIANAVRDLEYHDEMLSLLKLPPQQDRDAVMILHLGGTFGDKAATIQRFRENYAKLSDSIKKRIVLENDDVSWTVHDLLPLCEELNIPMCLDFHHHNIMFDPKQIAEGTKGIMELYPRIKATWDRKNITQKMHYSEPTPQAVTGRERRKHNPRPATLPPCANDMDLMIEAKDKEQAVFELMRTFKLPGFETFNNIVPYERDDDNRVLPKKAKKKKTKKQIAAEIEEFGQEIDEEEEAEKDIIPEEEVGMGGPENRVYWPPGMEEWLKPKKREIKKKGGDDEEEMFKHPTPANFEARRKINEKRKRALDDDVKEKLASAGSLKDVLDIVEQIKTAQAAEDDGADANVSEEKPKKSAPAKKKTTPAKKKTTPAKKKTAKVAQTPSVSNPDEEDEEEDDLSMPDLSAEDEDELVKPATKAKPARQSARAGAKKRKSYAEADGDMDLDEE
jgi:UV DNA damage endonuclease